MTLIFSDLVHCLQFFNRVVDGAFNKCHEKLLLIYLLVIDKDVVSSIL